MEEVTKEGSTISTADGVLVDHKVGLSLDMFSARPCEAQESQNSNQYGLEDKELDKESTFVTEVFFDEGVGITQEVSEHLEGVKYFCVLLLLVFKLD